VGEPHSSVDPGHQLDLESVVELVDELPEAVSVRE